MVCVCWNEKKECVAELKGKIVESIPVEWDVRQAPQRKKYTEAKMMRGDVAIEMMDGALRLFDVQLRLHK